MNRPREDWLVSEQFRVVRVSSLPYAHNPSRCDHLALFRDSEWDGIEGRRFFESLTDQHFRSCTYHQLADWQLIARVAVQLFRKYRNRLRSELYDALERAPLTEQDLLALQLIFHDPIVWGGQAPHVTNGQHRVCAIRASRARLCVIDHDRFDPYALEP